MGMLDGRVLRAAARRGLLCLLACAMISPAIASTRSQQVTAAAGPVSIRAGVVENSAEIPRIIESGGTASLKLSGIGTIPISITSIGHTPEHARTARGRVGHSHDAGFGYVTLAACEGAIAGVIRDSRFGLIELKSGPDGSCSYRQLDPRSAAACGTQCDTPRTPASRGESQPSLASELREVKHSGFETFGEPCGGCNDGSQIDVLVVYTEAAREGAGGLSAINALIVAAITDSNQCFSNSEIETELHLVHSAEIDYVETGDSTTDLTRLIDPDDGILDEVHVLRDAYGADLVSLWVQNLEVGGRVISPIDITGIGSFHEMRQDNVPFLIMAHETGHNFGCAHDREHAFVGEGYFGYSYGYRQPDNEWKTVMSYPPPDEISIPYFSNPDVMFMGEPTGVPIGEPLETSNAGTIQQMRHMLANMRGTPLTGLPAVLYVDTDAPPCGDGASWATAVNDLQDAICLASRSGGAVQQIWVAEGTYKPDRGLGLRQMSFLLRDGLALYGGFAGGESDGSERDIDANSTILSGDIGASGDPSDNSWHVVEAYKVGPTAVLDGFTIRDGNADTYSLYTTDNGAGLRTREACPTIANCTFIANAAYAGGAINCYAGSAPAIIDCDFLDNVAVLAGGAIHVKDTSAAVEGCMFSGNTTVYGGAVANDNSSATYAGCVFDSNTAAYSGGGVHNYSSATVFADCVFTGNSADYSGGVENQISTPMFIGCEFDGNDAYVSGGAGADQASDPTFQDCHFFGNTADYFAGLGLGGPPATVADCHFEQNIATYYGGGIGFDNGAAPVITGCTFDANEAGYDGGGVYASEADLALEQCTFTGNSVGYSGGAVRSSNAGGFVLLCTFIDNDAAYGGAVNNAYDSTVSYMACGFYGNTAGWSGGAAEDYQCAPLYASCLFSGNTAADSHGGGLSIVGGSDTSAVNCTFSGNTAGYRGGGIAIDAPSPAIHANILWSNSDGLGSVESSQIHHFSGAADIAYSLVQGWTGALGGMENSGDDPQFADPDGADNLIGTLDDDPAPASGSPAIDSGNNDLVPGGAYIDLAGGPRFDDDPATTDTGMGMPPIVDRGAFEFGVCAVVGDVNGDGAIDGDDVQPFVECLLGGETMDGSCSCADITGAGLTTDDLAEFVTLLLAS